MGFDRNMVDDIHFTYYSHKKPDFIVLSPIYKAMLEAARLRTPDAYNFAESMLANQFQRVYSVQGYDVLQRKTAQLSLSAPPVLSGEGGG